MSSQQRTTVSSWLVSASLGVVLASGLLTSAGLVSGCKKDAAEPAPAPTASADALLVAGKPIEALAAY